MVVCGRGGFHGQLVLGPATYTRRVIFGEPQPGPISLVGWEPAWVERFERERTRIREAVGDAALRIEHIGSTSVPGLAAKPIVDILLTVADVSDEAAYLPALERAGYILRVREEGHRMVRPPDLAVHVHVWADDDPECDRYLRLRDRLRSSPEDRAAYERLKRELAPREWADMNDYAEAKGPLIEAILARANVNGLH
jgi:GrpB-like predicted nucleotidyltransferase (UPF0157 family)